VLWHEEEEEEGRQGERGVKAFFQSWIIQSIGLGCNLVFEFQTSVLEFTFRELCLL
jgi:hypothetical protein